MATPRATPTHALLAAAAAVTGAAAAPALAQWVPPYWAVERIGLYEGPEFTAPDGAQTATLRLRSASGRITGISDRFVAGADAGRAAWTWAPGHGTQRLGFLDAPLFTSSAGAQYSDIDRVSASGLVAGRSHMFNGSLTVGQATWAWDPDIGLVATGLAGPEFTGPGGRRADSNDQINASGRITGRSTILNGTQFSSGRATWTWSPSTGSVRTGLHTDAEFTRADGYQESTNQRISDAGRIIGSSNRYAGNEGIGVALWTWDESAGTTRIGLYTGPEFILADGYQYSLARGVNAAGLITGQSARGNNGPQHLGQAAWVWTPAGGGGAGGSTRIGFYTGPEFTRDDGLQHSANIALLESGRVIGTSRRFAGPAEAGDAAWTWTQDTGTVRIGLYDAVHTSDGGVVANTVRSHNQSGVVVGTTDRSGGGPQGSLGRSAWFFDPATDLTTELVFSVADDGRAGTAPTILTESGWVLGLYDLYAGDSLLAVSTFLWSIDNGFTDLGALVDGGLPAAGVDRLTALLGAEEASHILARGLPLSAPATTAALYALTPIPTPAAATTLFPLALLATVRRRRR